MYACNAINRPRSFYQYFNMALRLSGQNSNSVFKFHKGDLDTEKATPNVEVCSEALNYP